VNTFYYKVIIDVLIPQLYLSFVSFMSQNPSLPLALIVVTLLLSCANSSTLYNFTFDSLYGNIPSYSLGYIDDGYTVTVNLTTTATGTNAISLATAPLAVQLFPKDFTSTILPV